MSHSERPPCSESALAPARKSYDTRFVSPENSIIYLCTLTARYFKSLDCSGERIEQLRRRVSPVKQRKRGTTQQHNSRVTQLTTPGFQKGRRTISTTNTASSISFIGPVFIRCIDVPTWIIVSTTTSIKLVIVKQFLVTYISSCHDCHTMHNNCISL